MGTVTMVAYGLLIRIARMDDEVEGTAVTKPHGRKVADISRRESTDAKIFSEHDNRRVDKAEAKVVVSPVNFHSSRELIDRWRRIRERPAREVIHERIHRRPLAAQEIVKFCQHQSRNVPSACTIDRSSEPMVIRRALHKVVEQRAGIAD